MVRSRRNTNNNLVDNNDQHPTMIKNEQPSPTFTFQGKTYATYEEMVQAKRQRNEEYLKNSGLLDVSFKVKEEINNSTHGASQRGLKAERKRKASQEGMTTRRKSNRLAGVQASGMYVEDEKGRGKIVIGGGNDQGATSAFDTSHVEVVRDENLFYGRRINDGSDLSLQEAVELSGSKWVDENSLPLAQDFISQLKNCNLGQENNHRSPRSIAAQSSKLDNNFLVSQVDDLNVDHESCVAKVVPERIYSVAFHPSPHKHIVVAGDKKGHLGFWDVDNTSEENGNKNGVHLFKPYNHVISNIEWYKDGSKLFTSAYDGSMRVFDIQKQMFTEVFATYDSSNEYKGKLGYGLDEGWMQYSCIDHRNDNCIFYSTSLGDVVHLDLRQKGKITFNVNLSEKKINSVSLHPNGHSIATAGLDCNVNIWDVRNMKNSSKDQGPLVYQRNSKSINSAFFSPSGKHLLTTTMADTLDIFTDAHTKKGLLSKPTHRIRHDNKTGRWLSTFMAQWHPSSNNDIFVVGSMQQPRTMQIFNGNDGKVLRDVRGDALTAVVSRCCFHPSSDQLISAGGNSSGRVTIARKV